MAANNTQGDDVEQKESWLAYRILIGSSAASIYDLAWSPCGNYILAGSCEEKSKAVVWDINAKTRMKEMFDHSNFIHGVSWDPKGAFIATQSSDRSVNSYSVTTGKNGPEFKLLQKSSRAEYPLTENVIPNNVPASSLVTKDSKNKFMRLYHGESVMTFFRRLSFAPDGSFLLAPCGLISAQDGSNESNVSNIYPRNRLSEAPLLTVPTSKPSRAVRFNQVRYRLRTDAKKNITAAPYRYVYAVACRNGVTMYDTQSQMPFAYVGSLHYAPITDMCWSAGGDMMFISSTDGFCSVVCFDDGELGAPYVEQAVVEPDQMVIEETVPQAPIASEVGSTHSVHVIVV